MEIWDLTKESHKHRKAATSQKELVKSNGKINQGDIIEFYAGYNDDIRMRAEIAGLIGDDIYLIWECYWSPIRDDKVRKIKIIRG